jgi:hypothetical protein
MFSSELRGDTRPSIIRSPCKRVFLSRRNTNPSQFLRAPRHDAFGPTRSDPSQTLALPSLLPSMTQLVHRNWRESSPQIFSRLLRRVPNRQSFHSQRRKFHLLCLSHPISAPTTTHAEFGTVKAGDHGYETERSVLLLLG